MAQLIPYDARDGYIWMNDQMVAWREAKVHVLTHGLHYGSCVFEGERCYNGQVFKSTQHSQRLIDSGRILGFEVPYTAAEIDAAKAQVVARNGFSNCYIRALAFRGSEQMGVAAQQSKIQVAITAWEWGAYYSDLRLTRALYDRPAPNTAPVHAKAAGLYMICTISKHAAEAKGFGDALMLDYRGYVAETTGANVFLVFNGELHTPTPDCFLNGITRRTVIDLARRRGFNVVERHIKPEEIREAQEFFVTGTAAEITPVRALDDQSFPLGPVTMQLMDDFHVLTHGRELAALSFSVCVFCGSRRGGDPIHEQTATALGRGLAERGWRLVYGGGDVGLMGIVARGTLDAGGEVLGIIPQRLFERERGKREVDDLVVTLTMAERKERMIAESDAFVTLAGGLGTLDEVLEVMTLRQLGFIDKPILLVDSRGYWQPFVRLIDQVVETGFADPGTERLVTVVRDAAEALDALAACATASAAPFRPEAGWTGLIGSHIFARAPSRAPLSVRSAPMYSETTRAIRVSVEPFYVAEQSEPAERRYVFGYKVTIRNEGGETVRLVSRHWTITDGLGRMLEVRGPGVVGEQPRLEPGQSFQYTSGTPLDTNSGIMVGTYQMLTDDGEAFDARIPAFSLDAPGAPRAMN